MITTFIIDEQIELLFCSYTLQETYRKCFFLFPPPPPPFATLSSFAITITFTAKHSPMAMIEPDLHVYMGNCCCHHYHHHHTITP